MTTSSGFFLITRCGWVSRMPNLPYKTYFPPSSRLKRFVIAAARCYAQTLPRPSAPFPPSSHPGIRILIQSMGGIGNTLMVTPLLAEARRLFPNAHIDLLTTPGAGQLLRTNPDVSSIVLDQHGGDHGLGRYWRVQRQIRASRYDAALVTLNAVTFRFAARTALARIPYRIAHRYHWLPHDDISSLFSQLVPRVEGLHDAANNVNLLAALTGVPCSAGPLTLHVDEDSVNQTRSALARQGWRDDRPSIALCPGSSSWMVFKRWPRASFKALARELAASFAGHNTVVFFGPDEQNELDAWRREEPHSGAILVDAGGLVPAAPIAGFAAAISLMDVTVTNDSLPMHLCAGLQRPVVALFGPTDPCRTGPWQCPARVLTPGPDHKHCFTLPYHPHPAEFPDMMKHIRVADVLEAVRELLEGA